MITTDDTQLAGHKPMSNTVNVSQSEPKGDDTWKKVGIGGVTGILIGAGALYAGNALAANGDDDKAAELPKEANVAGGQSFSDAFNEARAQVGPGGVFRWHGRLYNTYTEEEWDNMSAEEKHAFAQAVAPEVNANDAYAQTGNDDVHVAHTTAHVVDHHEAGGGARAASNDEHKADDTAKHDTHDTPHGTQGDDDVHVVGVGQVQGHTAVALDLNGDTQADVAIIDINDNQRVDEADIVIDRQGNAATMGDLARAAGQDHGQSADDGLQSTGTEDDATASDPNIQASYTGDDISASDIGGDDLTGGYDPGDDGSVAL